MAGQVIGILILRKVLSLRRRGQVEYLLEPFVQQTDARAEQDDPSDGAEKHGNQYADGEQNVNGLFQRNIRPHEDPYQRHGDEQGHADARHREEKRVQEHLIGPGIGIHVEVVCQCQRNRFAGKTGAQTHENHHHYRHADENHQE